MSHPAAQPDQPPAPEPPRYVVLFRTAEGLQRAVLDRGSLLAGGSADRRPELLLDGLARSHARVALDGDRVVVTNLAGEREVWIDAVELQPTERMEWQPGQRLYLGRKRHVLELRAEPYAPEAPPAPPPAAAAPPAPPEPLAAPATLVIEPGKPRLVEGLSIHNTTAEILSYVLTFSSDGALGRALAEHSPRHELGLLPGERRAVPLTVLVPREPASPARPYDVTISPASPGRPELSYARRCAWTIAGYQAPRTSHPAAERRGTSTARFAFGLRNHTNAQVFYTLSVHGQTTELVEAGGAGEAESAPLPPEVEAPGLTFRFTPSSRLVPADPDEERRFVLEVEADDSAREELRHSFEVVARPAGQDASADIVWPCVFLQLPERRRPPLALLVGLGTAFVAALAIILLGLIFTNRTAGPSHTATASAASATASAEAAAIFRATQFAHRSDEYAARVAQARVAAQWETIVATAVISPYVALVYQTQTTVAFAQTAQAAAVAELLPALTTATALVNQQSTQAVLAEVAAAVDAEAALIRQTAEAGRATEVGAIAEVATGVAGQTATAVAGQTIVAQAQQQATVFAEARAQATEVSVAQTADAQPAALSVEDAPPCVVRDQSFDALVVTVRDRLNREATTSVVTVSIELVPVDSPRGATLGGETSRATHNGKARFFGLKISRAGIFRIKARFGRFETVTTNDIRVVDSPNASCLQLSTDPPAPAAAPAAAPPAGGPPEPEQPPLLDNTPLIVTPVFSGDDAGAVEPPAPSSPGQP